MKKQWAISIYWKPLEKKTSYPGNPLSARLTYIPNILSGSLWPPLASRGNSRRKTNDRAMTKMWILWTQRSAELNTMRGADSRWFLEQEDKPFVTSVSMRRRASTTIFISNIPFPLFGKSYLNQSLFVVVSLSIFHHINHCFQLF